VSPNLEALSQVVSEALDRAREQTMSRFRQVATEWKEDGSPVTEADRAAERILRELLLAATPDFGFLGEEFGAAGGDAGARWLVDPIDGTIAFSRGIPTWCTLVSLELEGEAVLGAIDLPCVDERYLGWRGGGVRCNGQPVRVSEVCELDQALVLHGDRFTFQAAGEDDFHGRLVSRLPLYRGYTDGFGHAMVLRGAAEAMIDLELNPWDTGPIRALVPEAGGRVEVVARGPRKLGLVSGAPKVVEALLALRAQA